MSLLLRVILCIITHGLLVFGCVLLLWTTIATTSTLLLSQRTANLYKFSFKFFLYTIKQLLYIYRKTTSKNNDNRTPGFFAGVHKIFLFLLCVLFYQSSVGGGGRGT